MSINDLACPSGLDELGQKAHGAIVAELKRQEATHTGGCKAFYSPFEWRRRGEEANLNSVLVVVHDGGAHAAAFNSDYECYETIEDMRKALEDVGCFVEQCTSWYSAVYSLQDLREKDMSKGCGNHDCGVSTAINDVLTFGSGNLDPNGFWERPCDPCARANERRHPEDGVCWPYPKMTRVQILEVESQMLRGIKERLGETLELLNNLMDTMRDRRAKLPDTQFERNKYNLKEVIDAIACAKDNLGKIEIPKE